MYVLVPFAFVVAAALLVWFASTAAKCFFRSQRLDAAYDAADISRRASAYLRTHYLAEAVAEGRRDLLPNQVCALEILNKASRAVLQHAVETI